MRGKPALRDQWGRFHRHEWRLESSLYIGCHQRVAEETHACTCGRREKRPVKPECTKCAENARLQEQVKVANKAVDLLTEDRDGAEARAERRKEALDAWGRYSLSSKPSKELLVEALRLTDAAEEPR